MKCQFVSEGVKWATVGGDNGDGVERCLNPPRTPAAHEGVKESREGETGERQTRKWGV